MKKTQIDPLLTANDVAMIFSCDVSTVYRLARSQELPHLVLGGTCIRFQEDQVWAFVDAHTDA